MLCLDVNVLVYAHRSHVPDHERYRSLVADWAKGLEPVGLSGMVLSGFVRLVTDRRAFAVPTPTTDAWRFVEASQPADGDRSVTACQ